MYSFLHIVLFMSLWDFVNFCRWNPDLTQMDFLWFQWGERHILWQFFDRCTVQNCLFFWNFKLLRDFEGLIHFFGWNLDLEQINFLCFLNGKRLIPTLFYQRMCYAKKIIFLILHLCMSLWDFALTGTRGLGGFGRTLNSPAILLLNWCPGFLA